ncbi:MAG: hypothetical protein VZR00_06100 [Lachnospiraceae bacterium]|nr:hypothetical protein [Lachnospiraceae bacterium]MEE3461449.1 hypothetical protein [Lachnospiraceae bacterium]
MKEKSVKISEDDVYTYFVRAAGGKVSDGYRNDGEKYDALMKDISPALW